METHRSILLDRLVDVERLPGLRISRPRLCFLSSDRLVVPQRTLEGHVGQYEQQAPPPQPFEPAGLSQGQWRASPRLSSELRLVGFNLTATLSVCFSALLKFMTSYRTR